MIPTNIRPLTLAAALLLGASTVVGCGAADDDPLAADTTTRTSDVAQELADIAKGKRADARAGSNALPNCVLDGLSPRTLPVDGAPATLNLDLLCDRPLTARDFGQSVSLTRERTQETAEGETPSLALDSLKCSRVADKEDEGQKRAYQSCSLTFSGLKAPSDAYPKNIGRETLTLEAKTGQSFEIPMRWHLPASKAEAVQATRDTLALPAGYTERGLDVQVKATKAGRVAAGAMQSADGTAVELFTVAPDGTATVHSKVATAPAKLADSGLEVARINGNVEMLWWGLTANADKGSRFVASTVRVDARGNLKKAEPVETQNYRGPGVAELYDTMSGLTEVGGTRRLSVRALARSTADTLITVRLVDAKGPRVGFEQQFDTLGGTPVKQLAAGRVGLLASGTKTPNLDADRGIAWWADKSGLLQLRSFKDPTLNSKVQLTSVQWPYRLNVNRSSDTQLAIAATSGKGDDATQSLELACIEKVGLLCGTTTHLKPPEGVTLSGFPSADDNGRTVGNGTLASGTDSYVHFGTVDATGDPCTSEWESITVSDIHINTKPVAPTNVRPAVAPRGIDASGAKAGERVLTTVTEDGALELTKVSALLADCTKANPCVMPLTNFSYGGKRLVWASEDDDDDDDDNDDDNNDDDSDTYPGSSYQGCNGCGDILIDGVPLVFDMTAAPVIIDAPGATGLSLPNGVEGLVMGPIDHGKATHVVWSYGANGVSAPGYLNLDTGKDGPALWPTEGVLLQDGGDGTGDGNTGFELTVATTVVDFRKDRGDKENKNKSGQDGPTTGYGTFTLPLDKVLGAPGTDTPVTFDVRSTASAANSNGDDGGGIYDRRDIKIILKDNSNEEIRSDAPDTTVLTDLTAAQADRPVVAIQEADRIVFQSTAADGTTVELASMPATLPGGSQTDGFAEETQPKKMKKLKGVGNGKIRRIMIKKKRIGGNPNRDSAKNNGKGNTAPTPTYQLVVEALDVPASLGDGSSGTADKPSGRVLLAGDFNGDQIEDYSVTTDGSAGTTVLFGDGLGGFLPTSLPLLGGPTITWPSGANASTYRFGSGTKRSTTTTGTKPDLL